VGEERCATAELRFSSETAAAGISERVARIEDQENRLDGERGELAAAVQSLGRDRAAFDQERRETAVAAHEAKQLTAAAERLEDGCKESARAFEAKVRELERERHKKDRELAESQAAAGAMMAEGTRALAEADKINAALTAREETAREAEETARAQQAARDAEEPEPGTKP